MSPVAQRASDPAERSGYLRYFYRNWRPTRLGRFWSHAYAWVVGLGFTPEILVSLQVMGRRDGRLHSAVLVSAQYKGSRYLVSMLGENSEWVQNVRASHGEAWLKRGQIVPIQLTEIAPEHRAPILKAWCKVATSGRKHLPVTPESPDQDFEVIAKDYPVFRIDPA